MNTLNLIVVNSVEALNAAVFRFVPEGATVEPFPVAEFKHRSRYEVGGVLNSMRTASAIDRYFWLIIPLDNIEGEANVMHADFECSCQFGMAGYTAYMFDHLDRVVFGNGKSYTTVKSRGVEGADWYELAKPILPPKPPGQNILRHLADYLDERYETPHLFRKTRIYLNPTADGKAIDLNLETDDRELVDRLVALGWAPDAKA